MMELLALPPVQRAVVAVLVAGLSFPIVGVVVVHLNLITMRFALMHGALLGGALGLVLGLPPLLATAAVGLVLVAAIGTVSRRSGINLGAVTGVAMAVTVAAAAALAYRLDLPARDALSILWGNVFALRDIDLVATIALAACIGGALVLGRRQLVVLLFDRDVAKTTGVAERVWYYGILVAVALTVAVAMRLVGALLLDVLLLLPALAAGRIARSMRGMFVLAGLFGLGSAAAGFALALAIDLPVSTGVAAAGVTVFVASVGCTASGKRNSVERTRRVGAE